MGILAQVMELVWCPKRQTAPSRFPHAPAGPRGHEFHEFSPNQAQRFQPPMVPDEHRSRNEDGRLSWRVLIWQGRALDLVGMARCAVRGGQRSAGPTLRVGESETPTLFTDNTDARSRCRTVPNGDESISVGATSERLRRVCIRKCGPTLKLGSMARSDVVSVHPPV